MVSPHMHQRYPFADRPSYHSRCHNHHSYAAEMRAVEEETHARRYNAVNCQKSLKLNQKGNERNQEHTLKQWRPLQ